MNKRLFLAVSLAYLAGSALADNTSTTVQSVSSAIVLKNDVDYHISSTTPFTSAGSIDIANTEHAVVIFDNLRPSLAAGQLKYVTINGAAARNDVNCQVRIYDNGAIVLPYVNDNVLTVYSELGLQGESCSDFGLGNTNGYMNTLTSAQLNNRIKSFKLKRGYMVTFSLKANGRGYSRCFVAANGDLEVDLPALMQNRISSYRIFKWQDVSKKGLANNTNSTVNDALNTQWCYAFGTGSSALPDRDCVPHKLHKSWPSTTEIGAKDYSAHMKTSNEPANSADDNPESVSTVLGYWEDLMATGMRLCSPSQHDGGESWTRAFMDSIDARGWRCDIVDIHCYWNEWNLLNSVDGYYSSYGRPVWISEWLWGSSWGSNGVFASSDPVNENATMVQKVINKWNSSKYVERYAYWNSETKGKLYDNGITKSGKVYRDTKAGLAYNPDIQFIPKAPPVAAPSNLTFIFTPSTKAVLLTWKENNGELTDSMFVERKIGDGEWERVETKDVSESEATYYFRETLDDSTPSTGAFAYRIHIVGYNGKDYYSPEACYVHNVVTDENDVTDQYFANPSFETLKAADGTTGVKVKTALENGLYGWEVAAMSNYQVESGASGSSTGFPVEGSPCIAPSDGYYYYFNRQGWSNKNSVLKTTTTAALPTGTYYVTIDYKAADYSNNNNASNNGTTMGLTVTDEAQNVIGQNAAVRRSYSLTNNSSNPGSNAYMKDAAWTKMGAMFTVVNDTKVTVSLVQNMKNNGRSDIAYDNLKLYKIDESTSESNTYDISAIIMNANTSSQLGGWTIADGNTFHVNTWSTEGNSDGSGMTTPFFEDWVAKGTNLSDATITATATHLVPGVYEFGGLVRTRNEAESVAPTGATIYANDAAADACDGNAIDYGTYGRYSVKALVDNDGKLEMGFKIADANFNWIAFKDLTVKYLGADKGLLDKEMATAQQTLDAYTECYTNSIAMSDDDKATYKAALDQAQTALDHASTMPAISAAISGLENARQAYVVRAYPTNGTTFDMTFLVKNPDATADDGWTLDGNFQTNQTGEHWSGVTNRYFDTNNWSSSAWTCTATQKLSVPNGRYTLKAAGRASTSVTLSLTANNQSAPFNVVGNTGGTIATDGTEWESVDAGTSAGKAFANADKGYGWSYATADVNVLDSELTIGASATATANHQWASFDDFSLTLTGAPAVTMNETDTELAAKADGIYDVTLNRTLSTDHWTTLCVPFDMDAANFIEAKELTAVSNDNATLTFTDATAIEAGKPYLVKSDVSTVTLTNAYVTLDEPTATTVGYITLMGNYTAKAAPQNAYIVSDDAFCIVNEADAAELSGFCAYIVVSDQANAPTTLVIDIDGKLTSIPSVLYGTKANKPTTVYNLNGQKVNTNGNMPKGLYIVNGKKVVK